MKVKLIALLSVIIIAFCAICSCGQEPPPPQPPPIKRTPPPKIVQLIPPEEKPRLAETYPEQAYVEIFAYYDFLYDKYEGNRDKLSDDLIKIMKKFGYSPKDSDEVEGTMNNLAKQLDEIINNDREKGELYLGKLNELIDARIKQLWEQEQEKSEKDSSGDK